MGYSKEEKDLLLSFYENHKDLISAVMTVIQDDSGTPVEIKETAKKYNEALSKYAKYTVKWTDKNGEQHDKAGLSMSNLAKEFALYLLDQNYNNNSTVCANIINDIFKKLTDSNGFFFADDKKNIEKYHLIEIEFKGHNYYLQQDWRSSGKSAYFPLLLRNIKNKKEYISFEIEEI